MRFDTVLQAGESKLRPFISAIVLLFITLGASCIGSGLGGQSGANPELQALRTYDWSKLRRPEFEQAAAAGALAILPLGTTEQHGLHLPMNVDIDCAQRLSFGAAERIRDCPIVIAPPLAIGCSPSFVKFGGTISLPMQTVMSLVGEVCRGVASHGFRRILVVNGHAGHDEPLKQVSQELAAQGILMRPVTYWLLVPRALDELFDVDKGKIGHAGEIETSLALHFQPENVDMSRAVKAPGVGGDPATATADKGRRLAAAVEEALVRELRTLRSTPLPAARGCAPTSPAPRYGLKPRSETRLASGVIRRQFEPLRLASLEGRR